MPALAEAIQGMDAAVEALAEPDLPKAVVGEQGALAALIRARENVRKLLSQSNSQSASACRNFDREQRQKLRTPERKKSDPQQELAQRRAQLDDLAKREREWSQKARQSCQNAGNSASNDPPPTAGTAAREQPAPQPGESPDSKSREESVRDRAVARADAAREQQALIDELTEIQRELEKLAAASDAARRQGDEAAGSMQQGLEALRSQEGQQAGHEGERAAKQIEQLASHLSAMHARDFGKRLDQAQQSAQQLASQQSALGNQLAGPTPDLNAMAHDQADLATQLEMLAELLASLRRDSAAESGSVKSTLDQMEAENPSSAIGETMRQAAQNLQAQRPTQGMKNVTQASERLEELSGSLAKLRRDYATPQLKELMALEEQLAQLMQQARRTPGGKEQAAGMQQQWDRLEPRLDRLAASDSRLAEAMQQVREGSLTGNAELLSESRVRPAQYQVGQDRPMPEGHYSWLELGDFHGPDSVAKVLQTKIQEAILAAAVIDANQPVPPAYKELVERYYRALSDDLR